MCISKGVVNACFSWKSDDIILNKNNCMSQMAKLEIHQLIIAMGIQTYELK